MKKIVVICGPTAVGKSKIALELAEKLGGEIVSADSGQVWEGLDIGTAKPVFDERRRVPHHLIDVSKPGDHFDVSRYVELADQAIAEISARGHIPFIVGGTGLYFRILLHGLCSAPPQDKEVRKKIVGEMDEKGLAHLYARFEKIDPEAAKKIHPNDKTRIIRALEVFEITGHPISHFQNQHRFQKPRYEAKQIGLNCDRALLHKNIERRVDWMIANGWGEEARELLKFYTADSQALQSIGYRELVAHLQGKISLEETVAEIKKQTRAYARRQLTWFRSDKAIQWFNPADFEAVATFLELCRI